MPAQPSFRRQLTLAAAAAIVAVALLSSVINSWLGSRTVRLNLVEQGRQITLNFAGNATLALLYRSGENVEQAARAVLEFPNVVQVAVYDDKHTVLLAKSDKKIPLETHSRQIVDHLVRNEAGLARETAATWLFYAPVYSDGGADEADMPFGSDTVQPAQFLGYVLVTMDKSALRQMGWDIFAGNIGIALLLAVGLLPLLHFLTARMTRPLNDLARYMTHAESGVAGLRADIDGPKDIHDMTQAFNKMMAVLEQREAELKASRDDALKTAHAKAEFAAHVSHEIRTPIAGILGILDTLEDGGITKKQRELVDMARSSGELLIALVSNILDLSKIEATKLTLEDADFDLRHVVEDVIELLAPQAQHKGLDIGYLIPAETPVGLRGDPVRLAQILTNLIGNAIKFTVQGEVAVHVQVSTQQDTRWQLRCEVSDSGVGIQAAAQKMIFDSFVQADGSTARTHGGSGLGLTICKQLVRLMGGEIGVHSQSGAGSTFWFSLPMRLAVSSPVAEAEITYLHGLQVLIVDAGKISTAFLRAACAAAGMRCDSIQDAGAVLPALHTANAQQKPYDLLLLDIHTLGMKTAEEIVHVLRTEPAFSNVHWIMMTRYERSAGGRTSDAQGLSVYLRKPMRLAKLYRGIERLLQQPANQMTGIRLPDDQQVSTLRERSILVVEDNYTHQMIITGMLARIGCRCEAVNNAYAAVEAVRGAAYDLVFMDCHLPDIDGFEAARRIRQIEAGGDRHTPIIALTAHAEPELRERCLSVGMDGYLEKPLRAHTLQQTLLQWLPTPASTEYFMPSPMTAAQQEPPLALDLNVVAELRDMLGNRGFSEMITAVLGDMPAMLERLQQTAVDNDSQAFALVLHTLIGSAKNIGARQLTAALKKLETEKPQATATLRTEIELIKEEYRQVDAALCSELAIDGDALPGPELYAPIAVIVDDDRSMRIALRNLLEADGFQVIEAEDGRQGLELCRHIAADIVLMDALMSGMNGFDACAELRTMEAYRTTPVLMITDLDNKEAIERAFNVGASDYVVKPVQFSILMPRVRRMIGASRAERKVRHLAYHDPLTGLPNRAFFQDFLQRQLERARYLQQQLAVLFIDLDRFKLINDTLGHDVGDRLLKTAAERIAGGVRAGDGVARLGGDEFIVVLEIGELKAAAAVAEKICMALSAPVTLTGRELFLGASIGIAVYPADGYDTTTLLKHADTAMYHAKSLGNSYRFYEHGMENLVSKRLELENTLHRALAEQEFVLHYQPQVAVDGKPLLGVEALIRRQHPQKGLIHAGEFIPLAEQTDLIIPIGAWVLREACHQLSLWMKHGFPPLRMAVNIAGRQLVQDDVVRQVGIILRETNIDPQLLELEITEGAIMQNVDNTIAKLKSLKDLGVRLAIDDFGTGYSSLSYLRRFPIDVLKIDRSFIQDITTHANSAAIVSGIIALAHSLRLEVVAEGVENSQEMEFLRTQGCEIIQGYYICEPLAAEELERRVLGPTRVRVADAAALISKRNQAH